MSQMSVVVNAVGTDEDGLRRSARRQASSFFGMVDRSDGSLQDFLDVNFTEPASEHTLAGTGEVVKWQAEAVVWRK